MMVNAIHPVLPPVPFPQRAEAVRRSGNALAAANTNAAPPSQRNSIFDNIDILDLSALAQILLGLGDGLSSIGTGFILTPEQQQQFDAIIAKHQGEAFTQENFNQLLGDLRAAGLAPEQLALEDHLRFFDLTSILLDAADGNNPGIDFNVALGNAATPVLPDERTNTNQYLLYVITQWQGISFGPLFL